MPGVLNAGGPPMPPIPTPDIPSTSQGLLSAPTIAPPQPAGPQAAPPLPGAQGPVLGAPGAAPGAQAAQLPQVPMPTYGQALAAMRHFDAIASHIRRILQDPAIGKSSVKKQIVDAVAELVADRIMTPGTAVQELAQVPERPFDQKTWLVQQLATTEQAKQVVVDHYRQSVAGMAPDQIDRTGDPENHLADMSALMAQYPQQQQQNGRRQ